MKATVSKPETWKRILDVEIPEDAYAESFRTKLAEYQRRVQLPGFRAGKVPHTMIESRFGDVIKAEVIESLIERSYKDSCSEHKISPITEGKVSKLSAEAGKPITFTIEAEVDPEIEIKGYDKLKVNPRPNKIKKGDVNKALDELRDRMAEFKDVERESRKGDFLTIEYRKVIIDGEEKKGISSPQYPIELGAGTIKDFDKGLSGSKAGGVVEVSIKFPGNYGDAELAGKRGDLTVLVTKVQEKILPEVNAEFLKKLGDFASEEALREKIAADLQGRENERARNEAFNRAIDQLIDKNDIDIPPSRVQAYLDGVMEEAARYARPGQAQPSREEIEQRYKDPAIHAMKRHRIIDYIATQEKIKPTQEEVDAEIRKLAEYYQQPFDQLKETLRQNGTVLRIRADLREAKTMNFLLGDMELIDEPE